jgi:hypothetical protein
MYFFIYLSAFPASPKPNICYLGISGEILNSPRLVRFRVFHCFELVANSIKLLAHLSLFVRIDCFLTTRIGQNIDFSEGISLFGTIALPYTRHSE